MPSDGLVRWQKKFNAQFPDGLLMTWEDMADQDDAPIYRIPRVTVLSMETVMSPRVLLAPFDVDKGFEFVIGTYEVIQEVPRLVRVTSDSDMPSMLWSGNISSELASAMRSPGVRFPDEASSGA